MNIRLKKITSLIASAAVTISGCASVITEAAFVLPSDFSEAAVLNRLAAPSFADVSFSVPEFRMLGEAYGENPVPTMTYTAAEESVYIINDISSLPSSFDMRGEGTVSSVKNQSSHGTCWSFAASASAETSLLKSVPSVDISELHGAYFSYYGDDQINIGDCSIEEHLDYGGNRDVIVNLWSQWKGPVAESVLPYGNTSVLEDKAIVAELADEADYHLENVYMFDYNNDKSNFDSVNELVKQFVYSGNAVDVSFYSNNSTAYNNYEYAAFSTEKPKNANHSVVIAGWDDNFPASAFSEYNGVVPENDGAWLVKNSWGATLGDFGYMWISYEDTSLCEFTVFEMGSKDNYSTIYNHDTFVPTQSMSAGDDTEEKYASYMANIFTAEQTEQIEAVSLYINEAFTEYEVTVYTDLSDASIPSSGTASTVTTGVSELTGCFTIELDEDVVVEAGEQFAVEVKLYNADTNFVIPLEACMVLQDSDTGDVQELSGYSSYEQICEFTGAGESFYSQDGKKWIDVTSENYVYTDEEKEEVIASLIETLEEDGESKEVIEAAKKAYRELFASGELMVIMGNFSLKAFGNPINTVDFSHISGAVPSDEYVSLSVKNNSDIYYSINGGEQTLYTAPIKITEKMSVSASVDGVNITEREYYPEMAEFNAIGYSERASGTSAVLEYAKRIDESNYVINLDADTDDIVLFPVTGAEVVMNGVEIENNKPTETIYLDNGRNVIIFELSDEDAEGNTIMLIINRGVSENLLLGDVNEDGIVDPVDATLVLRHYSIASMDGVGLLTEEQKPFADYDGNNIIDVVDATSILIYYSKHSMGQT